MNSEIQKCELCGESMPEDESMFRYHGFSGPCPKPPAEVDTVTLEKMHVYACLCHRIPGEIFSSDIDCDSHGHPYYDPHCLSARDTLRGERE